MFLSRSYLEIGSSWIPFVMSVSLTSLLLSTGNYLSALDSFVGMPVMFYTSLLSFLYVLLFWIRDALRDYVVGVCPSSYTSLSLLFVAIVIFSEVMVFFAVFWVLFWFALIPNVWNGLTWPVVGVSWLDAFGLPLFGTTLLLTSAVFVTWSHGSSSSSSSKSSLLTAILLGIVFLVVQISEYHSLTYVISSSTYGAIFFVSTGLHGLHVLVGIILLALALLRLMVSHVVVMEGSIWYWHFVDYVWLLLFSSAYLLVS
uniref:Cytochrome c oxidase subunit 3 n=1 Tax=Dicyema sp. TaxID=48272 RepID=A0A3G1SBZ6_9BILA|nr:cytochrome c oxidase subunit 3 [Dicyema sp.]